MRHAAHYPDLMTTGLDGSVAVRAEERDEREGSRPLSRCRIHLRSTCSGRHYERPVSSTSNSVFSLISTDCPEQFAFFRFLCLFEAHAVDRVRIRRREPEAYDFVVGQQIVIHGGLHTVDDDSIGLLVMLFCHGNSLLLNTFQSLLNTSQSSRTRVRSQLARRGASRAEGTLSLIH